MKAPSSCFACLWPFRPTNSAFISPVAIPIRHPPLHISLLLLTLVSLRDSVWASLEQQLKFRPSRDSMQLVQFNHKMADKVRSKQYTKGDPALGTRRTKLSLKILWDAPWLRRLVIFCVENNAAVIFFFFLQTINYRLSGSRGKTTDFDNVVPCKLFDHENVSNSNTLWHLKRFGPQDFMNMKKKKVLKLYLLYKLASLEKMCFFFPQKRKG